MSVLKNLDVLIMNARQLDEDALLTLYDNYLPHVFRFIFYHVDNRAVAENLTTKTFLKMLMAIPEFRGDGKSFYPWLLKIASKSTMEYLESRSDGPEVLSDDTEDIFRKSEEKNTIRRRNIANLDAPEIRRAVRKLADEEKQVLVLKLAMGLSNTEIAEVLDKSEGFIRPLQVKSLTSLRKTLERRRESGERVKPTISPKKKATNHG